MSKQNGAPAVEFVPPTSVETVVPEFHPAGRKRLAQAISDYSLTLQHALRNNLAAELERRALEDASVLPPLSAAEMFDCLVDSDPEFFNWCFPFCGFYLTKENLGYLHYKILSDFRASLNPQPEVVSDSPESE